MNARRDRHGSPTLLVRAGSILGALPLAAVVETLRPVACEAIAGAPAFVRGVSVLRGAPVVVVDLAALLGITGGAATRFVSMRVDRDRVVALAVEEVVGIRSLEARELGALPPLLGEAPAAIVSAVGTLDDRLVVVLRTARVVPPEVWEAVRARGGAAACT